MEAGDGVDRTGNGIARGSPAYPGFCKDHRLEVVWWCRFLFKRAVIRCCMWRSEEATGPRSGRFPDAHQPRLKVANVSFGRYHQQDAMEQPTVAPRTGRAGWRPSGRVLGPLVHGDCAIASHVLLLSLVAGPRTG